VSYALDSLKNATDVEERVFAAKWLNHLPPTGDRELTNVKALLTKCGDAQVRDFLAKALEEAARRQQGGAGNVPGP
jgi:hypothetical protein